MLVYASLLTIFHQWQAQFCLLDPSWLGPVDFDGWASLSPFVVMRGLIDFHCCHWLASVSICHHIFPWILSYLPQLKKKHTHTHKHSYFTQPPFLLFMWCFPTRRCSLLSAINRRSISIVLHLNSKGQPQSHFYLCIQSIALYSCVWSANYPSPPPLLNIHKLPLGILKMFPWKCQPFKALNYSLSLERDVWRP